MGGRRGEPGPARRAAGRPRHGGRSAGRGALDPRRRAHGGARAWCGGMPITCAFRRTTRGRGRSTRGGCSTRWWRRGRWRTSPRCGPRAVAVYRPGAGREAALAGRLASALHPPGDGGARRWRWGPAHVPPSHRPVPSPSPIAPHRHPAPCPAPAFPLIGRALPRRFGVLAMSPATRVAGGYRRARCTPPGCLACRALMRCALHNIRHGAAFARMAPAQRAGIPRSTRCPQPRLLARSLYP